MLIQKYSILGIHSFYLSDFDAPIMIHFSKRVSYHLGLLITARVNSHNPVFLIFI